MLLQTGPQALQSHAETDPLEASSGWQQLTANGSAHTKGNWAELFSSTAFDVYEVLVYLADNNATVTNTACLVDIGIGANPNEVVVIPNLNGGMSAPVSTTTMNAKGFLFPLFIPAGTRVAARCQHVTGGSTIRCRVVLRGRNRYSSWVGQLVTAYGADTSTSRGVTVVSGAGGSEGAWTQIVASITYATRWAAFGIGQATDTTVQGVGYEGDLGLGASTAEVEVIGGFWNGSTTTAELEVGYEPSGKWLDLPAGQRLAARLRHSGAAQSLDCIVYGVS